MLSVSKRKNEPAHYMLKIESFSLLAEAKSIKIESDVFEASGHKWRLELYPNGNDLKSGGDNISLYLVICDTESLRKGWEISTAMETGQGLAVEVFVVSELAQTDRCLSFIKPSAATSTYTWTIDNFSNVTEESIYSNVFRVGNVKWNLCLYPKGNNTGADTHLSIFLKVFDDALFPYVWRVYANFKLRVKNQSYKDDIEQGLACCFSHSDEVWGIPTIVQLNELHESGNGLLVNGVLIVEVEFLMLGALKNFI
uniref:ubiquitin C-terminal hydrolase 12-like n=1 Tax=Erigeron canadensis TaxID=72917 RepID=UPI001CB8B299|nr:ubiquitin C-terminal hydrolase 12-like [Erigeron canadensis]